MEQGLSKRYKVYLDNEESSEDRVNSHVLAVYYDTGISLHDDNQGSEGDERKPPQKHLKGT